MHNKKEEYKRKLKELAEDEGYISGIHSYCDRWCERCTMTSKCRVYAMEHDIENGTTLSRDTENKEFWEHMEMVFEVIRDFIEEMAEEGGISLDDVKESDNKARRQKSSLEKQANEYGHEMMNWLKQNREKSLETAATYQKDKLRDIENSFEVINWYCFFIGAKIHRAEARDKPITDNEIAEEAIKNDKNGSVKIAVIAIDRSIKAISVLYQNIPEMEDELLPFLIKLSRIRKLLLKKYPEAESFKRPGFDD